jgi:hypothetical protein
LSDPYARLSTAGNALEHLSVLVDFGVACGLLVTELWQCGWGKDDW